MNGECILNLMKERLVFLDGAMGTVLQQKGFTGNNDCLNLDRPELIRAVHDAYIAAGADIIESNTFSCNRISQQEFGLAGEAAGMAFAGVRLAREAADAAPRKVWVAGSIGPTSKSLSLAPDLSDPAARPYSFDEMVAVYREQAEALLEGGADLILVETCFDALNAKAALSAIPDGVPVIVSVSVGDRSGRTLTGQTLEAFWTSVRHRNLLAFGLNCSLGADELFPLVEEVSCFADVPVICYPNAGLPNEVGGYDQTPEQMAAAVKRMAGKGLVNIVGGCCGTTPAHIEAIRKAVADCPPRALSIIQKKLTVSGLEAVTVDGKESRLALIGERTNVAGSRKFARLIAGGGYDEALEIAALQIEGGARIIDINMDDAMIDGPAAMERFVRYIQNDPAVAKAALMIDSSHWECLLAGLKNAQGKCIVNSLSLKDGEKEFIRKALEIKRLGAAMVVMAFDEAGQAVTYDRKTAIAARAYDLLTKAGIPAEDIIFDVNVLSVGTGIAEHDRYVLDFIEAVRWIKQNLPGVSTSGGISNLSFAFRGNNVVRGAMHAVFLYHAVAAGLDMAIVNPGMLLQYDDIDPYLRRAVEDVILCRDAGATERLVEKAAEYLQAPGESPAATAAPEVTLPPEARLREDLISGRTVTLEKDVLETLEAAGSAVQVIEGPLMAAMEEVGERFGAGRMFLPQVVKSAKVMKEAVAILEPHMGAEADAAVRKPLVINATVKGDVHDIGKNIAGIVLKCNGFEVQDLGVMVDKETILETAVAKNADIIGVSGLITPSLFQMEELCREMTARGMTTPLIVGGATTSALHTAVKLTPLYAHVFHAADASAGAVMAKKLMQDREGFEKEQHAAQDALRATYAARKAPEAAKATPFPAESYLRPEEFSFPDHVGTIPLQDLVPLFDLRLFRTVWGIKGENPDIDAEGQAVLKELIDTKAISVEIAVRFFEASSTGDAIDLGARKLPMLRQETGEGLSLADFVPTEGKGPFGIFALSVQDTHPEGCTCEACRNEYDSMMRRAVKVTLAEAASDWLDREISRHITREGVRVAKPAAGYASCPDHSLKRDILSLLPHNPGIVLTETCSMRPDAAICGFILVHPGARYPEIRHIGPDQYNRYSKARGFSEEEARLFLSHLQ